jgi:hypothetical protein
MLTAERNYANPKGYAPTTLGKRSDEDKARDCSKYLMVLAEQRLFWEPMIDNIILYVNHGRRFVQDWNLWPGQQTGQEIYDDTAMLARNMLVDGMVGYLCSRNQPWFALEIPGKFNFPRMSGMRTWNGKRIDEYPQVQRWLQDAQTVMYSAFNRSNFYDVVTEFISDGATCGTATIQIEEDMRTATQVFTVPHFREIFIAQNQFGQVDTVYRIYRMTLKQLSEKFGWEAMKRADNNFERDYKSNYYAERDICHAIYPREDYEPWRIDARGKKWESVWLYRKGGKILEVRDGKVTVNPKEVSAVGEGGYDSMPMVTWRWRRNADEIYGRGPAHDAFIAVATANQMGRTNLVTAQKAAEPPLVAYSDMRGAIQVGPKGITYIESNRGDIRMRLPQPLYTGVQTLPYALEAQKDMRSVIHQHFHTDVFAMMSSLAKQSNQSRMVVEQVLQLQQEQAAILGTRVGNLQSEAFDKIISRVFSIEAAAGRIPFPPDILLEASHGPVEVQYLGPLAQAQTRLTEIRAMQTGLQLTAAIMQQNPVAGDVIDWDKWLVRGLDKVGFPADLIRDDKMVAQIRMERNKQMEHQQQIEALPKIAKSAAQLSKSPEAGSIVQQMLTGGEG